MRIVIIPNGFSEKMGYASSCLPKALASLGQEVHVVAPNVQVYFDSPYYKETYESYLGPGVVDCDVKTIDGYTLHRLPYLKWRGRIGIKGLMRKLRSLRPQIVQTFDVISFSTYEAALAKFLLKYKLFTGNHVLASVFPPATQYHRMGKTERLKLMIGLTLPGRVVDFLSIKCYPATADAAEIAVQFYGVQRQKLSISPLGVDTDLFHPVDDEATREARARLRQQLGFAESEIVCIYTGRFTEGKSPLYLAQAIALLVAEGEPFRGLFVGSGPQEDAIRACPGCVTHPFVPFRELASFFRSVDIGVWPRQESTSMLDASACGIPIVVSNRVQAVERFQGNGVTYNEGDPEDLMRALYTLKDSNLRNRLGSFGAAKISREYSWISIAQQRLKDYEAALQS